MTDKVYELNIGVGNVGQQWAPAPSMITPRNRHTCSHITTTEGDDEIIVVGGDLGTGNHDWPKYNAVQIYSVKNRTWRSGMHKVGESRSSNISNIDVIFQEMISLSQFKIIQQRSIKTHSS